ncbi:MAG: IPT/TIG domain-containing protein [Actinomycetota bacterium]
MTRKLLLAGLLAVAIVTSAVPAIAAGPSITGFTPGHGPVGTVVAIRGSGFAPGDKVAFDGSVSPNPKVNAAGTEIRAAVPPFATTGRIRVMSPTGASDLSDSPFRVTFGASISPRRLFAGQRMRISGSRYPSGAQVDFAVNGDVQLDGALADSNGSFSVLRRIPPTIPPGKTLTLQVGCVTPACPSLGLPFGVFSDWPQERWTPSQSGENADEWMIGPGNLAKLQFRINRSGAIPISTPVVERYGLVFAGFGAQGVLSYGATTTNFSTGDESPSALAVDGGVLYAVTADTLLAYDAFGKTNCSDGLCGPLWTAHLGTAALSYPPVAADGKVFLSEFGPGKLEAFDAAGVTNCSGSPKLCTPLWSTPLGVDGPPAVSAVSSGGTGRVYVPAYSPDRVAVYDESGVFQTQSATLPGSIVGGPALRSGKIAVTTWASNVATLTVLSAAGSLATQWSSNDLGGSEAPSAPALTPGAAFVVNSAGRLWAFAAGGCGLATCAPSWRSAPLGAGLSIPPVAANGVVLVPANADTDGLDMVFGFLAAGTVGCSGTPLICTAAWTYPGQSSALQHVVSKAGGLSVAGGRVFAAGGNSEGFDTIGL